MKHFLIVCLLFLSFSIGAQTLNFSFKGTIENSDLGKNEPGVTVSLVQGSSTISSATTASNGKYTLKGNVNYKQPFSVVFSKAGMVSKKVNFNFSLLNEEDIPAGSEYQPLADLSMALFSEKPNVDFSFLKNEPVASFDWDANKMIPDLDRVASDKMKAKIEKMLLQADQNNAANDAKYQAAIKEADNLYLNLKKYEEALAKYEEALSYKPKEKYPNDRILELDALIQAKKKEDLAAQQADSEYFNLIKAADALRDQKKYELAIAKYEEAITKKNEQYPKDQVTALKKLIEDQKNQAEIDKKYADAIKAADMFYTQKSWEAAKEKYTIANQLKPTEQHPITRLADIEKKLAEKNAANEKKKKYDEAIAAADDLFKSEKYEEAKLKYQEAQTLIPTELYPPDQIKECDAKILAKAKEKEKADQIAKLLADGGTLMAASKWAEAKLKYTAVLGLDPTNVEAKQKLDEIAAKQAEAANQAELDAKFNKLVTEGDLAAKGLKYTEAQQKYESALALKKDAAVQAKLDDILKKIKEQDDKKALEEKFQQLKTEGMKLAAEQNWLDAKAKLTEAQSIKTDAAITAKLKEIEEKIKANEALTKLEQDYKDLIAAAEAKEAAKEYDAAIAKYREASGKKPAEQLPKDRIAALELLKLDSAKQKEIDEKYKAFIKSGDDLVKQQKYIEAIQQYNEALALKPTEQEPVDKAKEAERLSREKTSEADALFEKILTAAQNKIDEKDYVNARKYAQRAAENRTEDPRPKELIRKIDELEKQL
jgi:tetratricopeptide (TPR) repeat protein